MIYFSPVESGRLSKSVSDQIRDGLTKYEGKTVQIEISEMENGRSARQNRFLWGLCYKHALAGFKDMGDDEITIDDVHEMFKAKFCEPKKIFIRLTSEMIEKRTTTRLTKAEFSEYTDKIIRWCATYLKIVIPDPNQFLNELNETE